MSFKQELIERKACKEAIDWVEDRTIEQAWNDCHHGDWMLWLLEEMKGEKGWPDEKQNTLLGCWCARRALKYIQEEETRPLKAIETKEKWAKGEITREEMNAARAAASDAVKVAVYNVTRAKESSAAWGAARAVARAAAMTAAYDAANDAARAAAWGATRAAAMTAAMTAVYHAASSAAIAAASDEESLIQANYIRTQFTPPKGDLCLSNNN